VEERGSKLRADEQTDRRRADQGERATNREAVVTKGRWRKFGGRAVKECVLTGEISLVPERVTVSSRSEKSAKAVVAGGSQ